MPPSTYKNYKLYPGTLDRLYYTSYKTVSLHIIFFHFSFFLTSLRQGTNGYLHFPCKIVEILYVGVLFNIIGRRSCPTALNVAQKGTGIINHRLPVDNQSPNGSLLISHLFFLSQINVLLLFFSSKARLSLSRPFARARLNNTDRTGKIKRSRWTCFVSASRLPPFVQSYFDTGREKLRRSAAHAQMRRGNASESRDLFENLSLSFCFLQLFLFF